MAEAEFIPFMLGRRSRTAARSTGELAPTIAGAGDVELTPVITHHYEESPAPDVEKQLTTGNGNTLIRVSVVNSIGRSDAADIGRCFPPCPARAGTASPAPWSPRSTTEMEDRATKTTATAPL